jgi:hypothetical protein
VLKKLIIISTASAVAMLGGIGIASAHEAGNNSGPTCSSADKTAQKNKGHQLVGGNLSAQDVTTNVLGAQATRPAGICPSVGNNIHL